jgi:hypothetical protein
MPSFTSRHISSVPDIAGTTRSSGGCRAGVKWRRAAGEAEAVARHEGAGPVLRVGAELLLRLLVVLEALGLVVVGEQADEAALVDEHGASGRQALVGDALGADEAGTCAVVYDGHFFGGNHLAKFAHERGAGGVEHGGLEAGHDQVVEKLHGGFAAEDDAVVAGGEADAADASDGVAGGLGAGFVGEAREGGGNA